MSSGPRRNPGYSHTNPDANSNSNSNRNFVSKAHNPLSQITKYVVRLELAEFGVWGKMNRLFALMVCFVCFKYMCVALLTPRLARIGERAAHSKYGGRHRLEVAMVAISSDSGGWVETLKNPVTSLSAGVVGVTLILFNRLGIDLDKVTDVQSRADILAVVACSAVLLNALSETDVEARNRDPVGLVGYSLRRPLMAPQRAAEAAVVDRLEWVSTSLLRSTPATSIHLIETDGTIACRAGVVGSGDNLDNFALNTSGMPILNKVLIQSEEVYLPDLQILPGKVEFTYLPINCQSVVVLPWGAGGAAVVGTNQAKSLKLGDIAKIRAVLRMTDLL